MTNVEPLTPAELAVARMLVAKFLQHSQGETFNPRLLGWNWIQETDPVVALVDDEVEIKLSDMLSVLLRVSWALLLDLSTMSGKEVEDLVSSLGNSVLSMDPEFL